MYLRGYQVGSELSLVVLCTDAAGSPVDPDAAPFLAIYDLSGAPVRFESVPVIDRAETTGLFQAIVYLDDDFAEGQYRAVATWVSGSHHGAREYAFEVLAGGDESGQVISLYSYERPHANFLVQQRTSGRIYKGRNPRVT